MATVPGLPKVNQARQAMVKAVRLAGPEEFIRPFLDRGTQIIPLLTLVLRTEKLTAGTRRWAHVEAGGGENRSQ
ncbi:MAG TPA: hypothetical protein G4N96_04050 [Chloroflexi bacterium]|nr:MAG: hypothetical protein B6243_05750 [Anaerolineaceae bacterium 4572_5.2]HEY84272.1 hypothetical protein [Chloroflexota bacterium]